MNNKLKSTIVLSVLFAMLFCLIANTQTATCKLGQDQDANDYPPQIQPYIYESIDKKAKTIVSESLTAATVNIEAVQTINIKESSQDPIIPKTDKKTLATTAANVKVDQTILPAKTVALELQKVAPGECCPCGQRPGGLPCPICPIISIDIQATTKAIQVTILGNGPLVGGGGIGYITGSGKPVVIDPRGPPL